MVRDQDGPFLKLKAFAEEPGLLEKSLLRGDVSIFDVLLSLLGDDMARKLKNRGKPNEELFAEYFDVIENSYSPAYFKEASRVLGHYRGFLAGVAPSLKNFSTFFTRYAGLKPNSRSRYYCAFSSFFKWYSDEKLPFKVRGAKLTPQFVSEEEVDTLKRAMSGKRSHKDVLERDLLIIDTMDNCGARRAEIGRMLVKHLHLGEEPSVLLIGKFNEERLVELNPTIAAKLKAFTAGKGPEDQVFNIKAKSISSKIGIWARPQLHPHSFRHKFATDLVREGVNLRVVQELLGHESLEVTQRYVAVTDKEKRRAVGMLDGSTQQALEVLKGDKATPEAAAGQRPEAAAQAPPAARDLRPQTDAEGTSDRARIGESDSLSRFDSLSGMLRQARELGEFSVAFEEGRLNAMESRRGPRGKSSAEFGDGLLVSRAVGQLKGMFFNVGRVEVNAAVVLLRLWEALSAGLATGEFITLFGERFRLGGIDAKLVSVGGEFLLRQLERLAVVRQERPDPGAAGINSARWRLTEIGRKVVAKLEHDAATGADQ